MMGAVLTLAGLDVGGQSHKVFLVGHDGGLAELGAGWPCLERVLLAEGRVVRQVVHLREEVIATLI